MSKEVKIIKLFSLVCLSIVYFADFFIKEIIKLWLPEEVKQNITYFDMSLYLSFVILHIYLYITFDDKVLDRFLYLLFFVFPTITVFLLLITDVYVYNIPQSIKIIISIILITGLIYILLIVIYWFPKKLKAIL